MIFKITDVETNILRRFKSCYEKYSFSTMTDLETVKNYGERC